ncbi:hypothetical protein BH24ACT19_BH24ACT19_12030 [soil metagenome]
MWGLVAGFAIGMMVGINLPRILLTIRNLCAGSRLPPRATAFFSLLAANGASLAGGALVGWIAQRFEIWIAGGSVLAGLVIVITVYRSQTEQEPGKLLRAYALGFLTPFVLFAVLGAGLVSF